MPLTDLKIKGLQKPLKSKKYYDAKGLYLIHNTNNSKWWRFKYRIQGKEKLISLGVYPEITLKAARDKRDLARQQIENGNDPSILKKYISNSQEVNYLFFENIATEWMQTKTNWSEGHKRTIIGRFNKYLFPWLGKKVIKNITPPEVSALLEKNIKKGNHETAHRLLSIINQVFDFAIASGKIEFNPIQSLKRTLPSTNTKHFAFIRDPKRVGVLLNDIDNYDGSDITRIALQIMAHVFLRISELCGATWNEIDLESKIWRIDAKRMKGKIEHIIPLSNQVITYLNNLKLISGNNMYLFPSNISNSRFMNQNTITKALRRMGYSSDEMTTHGFRSIASTFLNENGWKSDLIEKQLSHIEKNTVRAAYNHASYLSERKEMMQGWSDYLDGLKNQNN